jgi:hypothetical protein
VVLQFEFLGILKRTYWLLIDRTDASVCLKNPGFDIDLIVTADIAAFYRVWLGRSTLPEAVCKGQVHLDGTPGDIRAFPRWFAWSPMADAVRAALANSHAAQEDRHKVRHRNSDAA